MEKLDIVKLIEKNSITRLSKNYENRLLTKVQNTFTNNEQQIFLASFYCYLNYNSKTDFVIDLDNIWKWAGFSRKDHAKTLILKHFTLDTDYKVQNIAPATSGAVLKQNGGQNKEQIMLTINTFKKFCLKSGTKKADEIHDYYIKLEELLQETVNEENDELREQLEKANNLINKKKRDKYEPNHSVYIISNPDIQNAYKIGVTNDRNRRLNDLAPGAPLHYKIEHSRTLNSTIERCAIESALLSVFSSNREINDTIGSKEREWIRDVPLDILKKELDVWVQFLNDRIQARHKDTPVEEKIREINNISLAEISKTLLELSETLSKMSMTNISLKTPDLKVEETDLKQSDINFEEQKLPDKELKKQKPRKRWSEVEENILMTAYDQHGPQWTLILKENHILVENGRSNVDLKDKYRNIVRRNIIRKNITDKI